MSAKQKDKLDEMLEKMNDFLSFDSEKERIDFKASVIQLDILNSIQKLMDQTNMTRAELAKKLNVSPAFVSRIFSGDKLINLKTIAQFQEIFNHKFMPVFIPYPDFKENKIEYKEDYQKKYNLVGSKKEKYHTKKTSRKSGK